MIEFLGVPESFRINKITESGGGLRFSVDMPENQRELWKQLSDMNGKLVKWSAELVNE